jgi:hypothetical protein
MFSPEVSHTNTVIAMSIISSSFMPMKIDFALQHIFSEMVPIFEGANHATPL